MLRRDDAAQRMELQLQLGTRVLYYSMGWKMSLNATSARQIGLKLLSDSNEAREAF